MIRQILLLLLLPVLPAVVLAVALPNAAESQTTQLPDATHWTLPQVLAHEQVLWIDARPAAEYEQDHIPGAMPLEMQDWDSQLPAVLETWSEEQLLVVYCSRSQCDASEAVAQRLRNEVGLPNVVTLLGGWEAWQNQ